MKAISSFFHALPRAPSDQRRVISLYIGLFGSVFLCFMPSLIVSLFAILFVILALFGLYLVREHSADGSFSKRHAVYMIRTFWTTNLFLLVFGVSSILFFLMFVKLSPLNPCVNALLDYGDFMLTHGNFDGLVRLFTPCEKPFLQLNQMVLFLSGFIAFFPGMAYFFVRFTRGFTRALKNKLI